MTISIHFLSVLTKMYQSLGQRNFNFMSKVQD